MTAADPGQPGPDETLPAPRRPVEHGRPDWTSSAPAKVAWAPITTVLVDLGPGSRAPRREVRFGWWPRVATAGAWISRLASPSRPGRTIGVESLTDRQLADVGLMRADLPDHRGWRR